MTTTESILIPAVAFFALLSTILVFLLDKAISKAKLYKALFQESERYIEELTRKQIQEERKRLFREQFNDPASNTAKTVTVTTK